MTKTNTFLNKKNVRNVLRLILWKIDFSVRDEKEIMSVDAIVQKSSKSLNHRIDFQTESYDSYNVLIAKWY